MKIENVSSAPPITKFSDIEAREGSGKIETADSPRAAVAIADNGKGNTQRSAEMFIDEEQIIGAIEHANEALVGADRRFEFSIHEGTKEIMVKVIDDETGEIIREIPPEKILDMVAKMWEMAGLLVDRKI